MNWFTKSYMQAAAIQHKKDLVEEWGGCAHVEADPGLLVAVSYENDSWGREGYCLCEACDNQAIAQASLEEHTCRDCDGNFPAKDMVQWKWYDFHAPSGEEPLWICNGCRTKDTHVRRVRQDRQAYEDEMARYDRSSDDLDF